MITFKEVIFNNKNTKYVITIHYIVIFLAPSMLHSYYMGDLYISSKEVVVILFVFKIFSKSFKFLRIVQIV